VYWIRQEDAAVPAAEAAEAAEAEARKIHSKPWHLPGLLLWIAGSKFLV
jgi:hypothetical protein